MEGPSTPGRSTTGVLDASDEPGGTMKSTWLAAGFFLAARLFPASPATSAQGVGASADLTGTVTDPSGAGVPNTKITVTDAEKGVERSVATDEHGFYRVSGLAPSTYKVSVEHAGFQTEVATSVVLTVGQTLVFDFRLKLSGMSSQVEVSSEPPIVETERASQANTLTQEFIADLPIDRRDYLTFTLLAPGVSNSTRLASDQDFRVKQTPQSGLSFYGSNGRGNSVTVDGGEANDDAGGVRLTLSQEAVQEFQINRSNYGAELGGASGATVNIVSKSGSNVPHGSLFGFFRSDVFDARNPFAFTSALARGEVFNPANPDKRGAPTKDDLNREQFGGTLGFPIYKDKTFGFVSFEGLMQDSQSVDVVLTNTSIFRPLATQNNNQQAIINGLAALGGTPVPCLTGQPALPAATCAGILTNILTISNVPAASPLNKFIVDQFENNGGLFPYDTRTYLISGRVDHTFSDHNSA